MFCNLYLRIPKATGNTRKAQKAGLVVRLAEAVDEGCGEDLDFLGPLALRVTPDMGMQMPGILADMIVAGAGMDGVVMVAAVMGIAVHGFTPHQVRPERTRACR